MTEITRTALSEPCSRTSAQPVAVAVAITEAMVVEDCVELE
jgi:hypothetical protein